MNLVEILKNDAEIEKMYENEEFNITEYQENKELINELIENKAQKIIFKQNEVNQDIQKFEELSKYYQEKANSLKKKQSNINNFLIWCIEKIGKEEIKTPIGKIKIKVTTSTDKEQLEKGLDANGIELPNECYDYIVPNPYYKRKDIKDIEKLGFTLKKTLNKKLEIK